MKHEYYYVYNTETKELYEANYPKLVGDVARILQVSQEVAEAMLHQSTDQEPVTFGECEAWGEDDNNPHN